jgi:4-alpha-glucanotransferase
LKKLFDNNSIRFQSDELKQIISRNSKLIHLDIVKYCMETKYPLVIIPLQDLIGLNGDCRMNEPGTLNKANWSWKSTTEDISDNLIETINTITYNSGRT